MPEAPTTTLDVQSMTFTREVDFSDPHSYVFCKPELAKCNDLSFVLADEATKVVAISFLLKHGFGKRGKPGVKNPRLVYYGMFTLVEEIMSESAAKCNE